MRPTMLVYVIVALMPLSGCQKQRASEAQSEPANASTTTTRSSPTSPATPAPSKPRIVPHASAASEKLGTLPDGVGLAIGTRVPDVEVKTHLGERTRLAKLVQTGPLLLIFYRGGW